jgi:hypothetical protein
MKEIQYASWRDYNAEDTVRFYALRLHEAGIHPIEVLKTLLERCQHIPISTPMRRTRSACCARAASGHAAVPQSSVMNSRRLMCSPQAEDKRNRVVSAASG